MNAGLYLVSYVSSSHRVRTHMGSVLFNMELFKGYLRVQAGIKTCNCVLLSERRNFIIVKNTADLVWQIVISRA